MIRTLDIFFSIFGLIILAPFFLIIALLLKIYSPGPVFYRQQRVGRFSIPFFLYKFRTMKIGSDKEGLLTVGGKDPRVSKIGYYLRKFKVDELPQLYNVLIGEMSLVGPRPEVQRYVDCYTEEQKAILNVRPGITDWASIMFCNENEILEKSHNPEDTYIKEIIPLKIQYNLKYINNYNLFEYFNIIYNTLISVVYKR